MGDIEKKDGQKSYLEVIAESITDVVKTKSNCKVCNSKFRFEVEKIYDEKGWGSIPVIYKFLKDNGEEVSKQAIRNHMQVHLEKQRVDLAVKDYIEDISKYRMDNISKKEALEDRRAMLNKMFLEITAQSEGATLDELRRNAPVAKMLSESLSAIELQLKEIENRIHPAMMISRIVQQVMKERIGSQKDNAIKSLLMSIFDEIEEKTSGVYIEEN